MALRPDQFDAAIVAAVIPILQNASVIPCRNCTIGVNLAIDHVYLDAVGAALVAAMGIPTAKAFIAGKPNMRAVVYELSVRYPNYSPSFWRGVADGFDQLPSNPQGDLGGYIIGFFTGIQIITTFGSVPAQAKDLTGGANLQVGYV